MPDIPDGILAQHSWIANARPVTWARLRILLPFIDCDDIFLDPVIREQVTQGQHQPWPDEFSEGYSETTGTLALPYFDQVLAQYKKRFAAYEHARDDDRPWGFQCRFDIQIYGEDWEVQLYWSFWSDALSLLSGLATAEVGRYAYNALDQCWALHIVRLPSHFAIREYDWDGEMKGKPHRPDVCVLVPCEALLTQISRVRHDTAEFMDRLERDLGAPCENPDDFDFYTEPGAKAMMAKHIWPEGM